MPNWFRPLASAIFFGHPDALRTFHTLCMLFKQRSPGRPAFAGFSDVPFVDWVYRKGYSGEIKLLARYTAAWDL